MRSPILKSDFQIINEDEEYMKNIELQAKNLKSKFLPKQNEKGDCVHTSKLADF